MNAHLRLSVFAACLFASPAIAAAQGTLAVTVFEDRNGNGSRDASERPLAGVVVSNQDDAVATDASGVARLGRGPGGVAFVSVPDGYRSVGPFWRAPRAGDSVLTFALQPARTPRAFSFIHGSDTHVAPENVERTRKFVRLVDSIGPAFTIVTGDLVRDAMSQQEPLARSYFELFAAETGRLAAPLWTVPGNHDHFGIIPSRSHVSASHPLYNRGMYHLYRGPDYYSFTFGGIHFVGLNTLATDDSAYYGQVDSVQLGWLRRDLALIPPDMPVVTFNHIPMVSAWEILGGFADMPLVGSIRRENGQSMPRHTVANVLNVIAATQGRRWVLALGGHMHVAEKLAFQTNPMTRFEQTGAIIGGGEIGPVTTLSGFTLYTVRDGVIDAGRFIPLDDADVARPQH